MAGRRRALITNDDGIDSEGIRVLARAACAEGLEVTVAAPSWDASGSSAAMAAVQTGGRVLWTERRDPDLVARLLAVEAAPAFIVRAAVHGELGPPPELVLSGTRRGPHRHRQRPGGVWCGVLHAAARSRGGRPVQVVPPARERRYQLRHTRRCTGTRRGISRRPGMNGTASSRIVARPVR